MSGGAVEAVERPPSRTLGDSGDEERGFPLARVVTFVAIWLGGSGLIVGGWLQPFLPGGWGTVLAALSASEPLPRSRS